MKHTTNTKTIKSSLYEPCSSAGGHSGSTWKTCPSGISKLSGSTAVELEPPPPPPPPLSCLYNL